MGEREEDGNQVTNQTPFGPAPPGMTPPGSSNNGGSGNGGSGNGAGSGGGNGGTSTSDTGDGDPEDDADDAGDGDGDDAPEPALNVSHSVADERVVITVDAVEGGFAYADVGILVDDEDHRFAQEADARADAYAVDGVDDETTLVAEGHVIRAPAAGRVNVTLHLVSDGRVLASFEADVPDASPPEDARPVSPPDWWDAPGSEVTLAWIHARDAGNVTYDVQFDYDEHFSGDPGGASDVTGTAVTIPSEWIPAAGASGGPQPALWWRVRAVDAHGNVGEWSAAWAVQNASGSQDAGHVIGDPGVDAPATPRLDLDARVTSERLLLTVRDVDGEILLGDLAVRAGSDVLAFGARPNPDALTFTTEPSKDADDPLSPGDRIVIAGAGTMDVVLLHLDDGSTLAEARAHVPDETPPEVPLPLGPLTGHQTVDDTITLQWAAGADPSGVTYDVIVSRDPAFDPASSIVATDVGEPGVEFILGLLPGDPADPSPPEDSDAPDDPDVPGASDPPEDSDAPDAPDSPDAPDAPGVPDAPEVPDAPDVPVDAEHDASVDGPDGTDDPSLGARVYWAVRATDGNGNTSSWSSVQEFALLH